MPASSLPLWLRVQAAVWLPVMVAHGLGAVAVPWGVLCAVVAFSFLTLCALLRSFRTPADAVTIARTGGIVAVAYAISPGLSLATWSALLALVLLDLVDGYLARRFGGTAAGAVLDMEADQFTVLLLSLLILRDGGPVWVLIAPSVRYVFVLAMWAAGQPAHEPKPVDGDNRRGRICCGVVVTSLLVALLPGTPPWLANVEVGVAIAVLVYSFSSDARFLLSRVRANEAES